MIRLEGVHAGIGTVEILSDITLTAGEGRLVTVIGANGAGKTTLLRVISNLLAPTAGTVLFDGKPVSDRAPHLLARNGLVHVPQGRQIIPTLSVEENLLIGARAVAGLNADDFAHGLEREYARFPILKTRRHLSGASLSGGEQQMLAVSRGLMMQPKVLMLDEPSLGLAPQIVAAILSTLRSLSDEGITVVLVEQLAMVALSLADDAYVLRNGRIAISGPAAELRKDRALVESYLG